MLRPMILVALIFGSLVESTPAQSRAPTSPSQEQLLALIKEVHDQQTELTANQAKIDEKLAAVAEAIRQARIYSSRGGR
jgi:hypothetical protein